jgi:hypothetical protein
MDLLGTCSLFQRMEWVEPSVVSLKLLEILYLLLPWSPGMVAVPYMGLMAAGIMGLWKVEEELCGRVLRLEIIREEVIMRCLLSNPSIILEHLHFLLLQPLPPCTLATTTQGLHLPPGSRVWSHLVGYLVLSVLNGLLHKGEGSHYHHHHHHHHHRR